MRFIFRLLFLGIFGYGIWYIWNMPISPGLPQDDYCAFCDRRIIDYQKFYEDDRVIALYPERPIVAGHCLILPKKHKVRFEDLTSDEMLAIQSLIKEAHRGVVDVYQADSYLLLQKNGASVGQTVPHVHFHLIPRNTEDMRFITFYGRFLVNQFKYPISREEMQANVSALKKALGSGR